MTKDLVTAFRSVDLATREAFHAAYRYRYKAGAPRESEADEYSLPSLHGTFELVFASYRVGAPLNDVLREEIPEAVAQRFDHALRTLPTRIIEPLLRLARQKGRDPDQAETLTDIVQNGLRDYIIRQLDLEVVS